MQIATAALQSYSHGTNDAQKAMGIITMALIVNNYQASDDIQLWVQFICALAMALGTSVGGRIMKIGPISGVAADLTGTMIIIVATLMHFPVSTSHQLKGVKWNIAKRMLITCVITLPISATLARSIYYILTLFF